MIWIYKKMCPAHCREYFTYNRPEICLSMFIGPHYQKLSYALNVLYLIWIFKYWDTCSCTTVNSYCYKTAYAVYNKIWYMYLQYILNAMQLYNDWFVRQNFDPSLNFIAYFIKIWVFLIWTSELVYIF